MNGDYSLWLALGGLVLACLAAIGAGALRGWPRIGVADGELPRDRGRRFAELLRRADSIAVSVESVEFLATFVAVGAGSIFAWRQAVAAAGPAAPPDAWTLVFFGLSGLVLVLTCAVWLPRAIVRLAGDSFLAATWPVWWVAGKVLAPLSWMATLFELLLRRLAGGPPERPSGEVFEEEIRTIVTEGQREGHLEEEAREMIEGIIELRDATVSRIMTRRTDMVSMHVGLSIQEAAQFVVQAAHTRIPVYDKSRDDLVGILYVRDLLAELVTPPPGGARPLAQIVRHPHFVPETKKVDDLLQEFQQNRNQMAIVLDEYGGVSGLVTIEDILEEIVGDIIDEFDDPHVEAIKPLSERAADALARVRIGEINERMKLALPDTGEFDTLGGFVFHELGRIPKVGESLVRNNVRFTVLEVARRRIERLRIEVLDPAEESATQVDGS